MRSGYSDIENAIKALTYWYTMEFLNQEPLPNAEVSKKINNVVLIRPDEQVPGKIGWMAQALKGRYDDSAVESTGELSIFVGRFSRDAITKKIIQLLGQQDPRIENTADADMALFALQTSASGVYKEGSFKISPLLWALKQVQMNKTLSDKPFDLDDYQKEMEEWDKKIQKIYSDLDQWKFANDKYGKIYAGTVMEDKIKYLSVLGDYLLDWYRQFVKDYVTELFNEKELSAFDFSEAMPFVLVQCPNLTIKDVNSKKDKKPAEPIRLQGSFIVDDLYIVLQEMKQHPENFTNGMGKVIVDYINGPCKTDECFQERVDIIPRQDMSSNERGSLKRFLFNVVSPMWAPRGRWPSPFPPALMQQVAVNMACAKVNTAIMGKKKLTYFNANGPIFSVNGPPGTGKTTLLKEIIVNNIVERANLLSNYENPDDALELQEYKYGDAVDPKTRRPCKGHRYSPYVPGYFVFKDDAVNNYGMLVCSCNNKAVENITTDIPVDSDVSQSIESFLDTMVKEGDWLDGISDEEQEKLDTRDFYFTSKTRKLLANDKAWGLIAAPMGKSQNISAFFKYVLEGLIYQEYSKKSLEIHKKLYGNLRTLFRNQYDKVCEMQKKLSTWHRHHMDSYYLWRLQERQKYVYYHYHKLEKKKSTGPLTEHETVQWDQICNEIQKNMKNMQILSGRLSDETEKDIMEQRQRDQERKAEFEKYIPLDQDFLSKLFSDDEESATAAHVCDPGFTYDYDLERKKLFLLAMMLQKEFVLSSKKVKYNLQNFQMLKNGKISGMEKRINFTDPDNEYHEDYEQAIGPALQTLFLVVPVISSTFASVKRFLNGVGQESIGMLIVDESGQASPQLAIGALYRSRSAMIVGDPKQVEPVVTDELALLEHVYRKSDFYAPYTVKGLSVQSFADTINAFGTYLKNMESEDEDRGVWVGSPLVVHRRCISPMYNISNALSYGGIMKKKSMEPKEETKRLFCWYHSLWFNIKGKEQGGGNHFVPRQGSYVLEIVKQSFKKYNGLGGGKEPDIFIISPFKTVAESMKQYIAKEKDELGVDSKKLYRWMHNHIGTVHTFQGQGAHEVIFLLGCDADSGDGTINFVNANIVNVAVTRAKSRLYVVGDYDKWRINPNIRVMQDIMNNMEPFSRICKTDDMVEAAFRQLKGLPSAYKNGSVDRKAADTQVKEVQNSPEKISINEVSETVKEEKPYKLPSATACKSVAGSRVVGKQIGKVTEPHPVKTGHTNTLVVLPVKKQDLQLEKGYVCTNCHHGWMEYHAAGKYGPYWHCPLCGKNINEKSASKLDDSFHYRCPRCHKGYLIIRQKGTGSPFWGCSAFSDEKERCHFMAPDNHGKPERR